MIGESLSLEILPKAKFYLTGIFLADHVSHVGRKKHVVIRSLQVSQSILTSSSVMTVFVDLAVKFTM